MLPEGVPVDPLVLVVSTGSHGVVLTQSEFVVVTPLPGFLAVSVHLTGVIVRTAEISGCLDISSVYKESYVK